MSVHWSLYSTVQNSTALARHIYMHREWNKYSTYSECQKQHVVSINHVLYMSNSLVKQTIFSMLFIQCLQDTSAHWSTFMHYRWVTWNSDFHWIYKLYYHFSQRSNCKTNWSIGTSHYHVILLYFGQMINNYINLLHIASVGSYCCYVWNWWFKTIFHI